MESTAPFELEALRRDWLAGVSGEEFYANVLAAQKSHSDSGEVCVIQVKAPIPFLQQFFAAVSAGAAVVLANPEWGSKEQEEFDQLLATQRPEPGTILIPTGGTTGGVKLAIHDWNSLLAAARGTQDFLGGGPVNACCLLPLHHVSGLMQVVRAFVSAGRVGFNADDIAGRCLSLVPTQLQRMMLTEEGIHKLNTTQVVFVGGAAMPGAVAQRARELKLAVVPVYGMTETAAMVAAVPNDDFIHEPDCGAVPLGDAQFKIDADGAVRIFGASLFKGYHGGKAIDTRAGYRTGDAGWLDAAGRLHLIGRMDALINTGGEKVNPAEVQEALLQLDGVGGAHVVGEPDAEWGEVVVAYLWPAPGETLLGEAEILAALKNRLSPFKIPKQIRRVDGPEYTVGSPR